MTRPSPSPPSPQPSRTKLMFSIGWVTTMVIMVGGDYYMRRQLPAWSDLGAQAIGAAFLAFPVGWAIASKAGLLK